MTKFNLLSRMEVSLALFAVLFFLSSAIFAQGNSGNSNGNGNGNDGNSQPWVELQSQIDDLQATIAQLNQGTVALQVDCAVGETVGDAIASVPQHVPVQITISGQCNESLTIVRDDVSLSGNTPLDGFSGSGIRYDLGATRNFLSNMTITASNYGVFCGLGSVVDIQGITFNGNGFLSTGILARHGGQCRTSNSTLNGFSIGVFAQWGALVHLSASTEITNSSSIGVRASQGGIVHLRDALVTNNARGILSSSGAHISLSGGEISHSADYGVQLSGAAYFDVDGPATISNNSGNGINVQEGSIVIHSSGSLNVTDNLGYGIQCTGGSQFIGGPNVQGNGAGAGNCPR